jgi:hypothetical protein
MQFSLAAETADPVSIFLNKSLIQWLKEFNYS